MAYDPRGNDHGHMPVNALVQGLTTETSQILDNKDNATAGKMGELLQATNKVADVIGDNLGQQSRQDAGYTQQIIAAFQNIHKKEGRSDQRYHKEDAASAKNVTDMISKIWKMGKTPRTFWVGLGTIHASAASQLSKILSDCGLCRKGSKAAEAVEKAAARRNSGGSSAIPPGGGGGPGDGPDAGGMMGGGGGAGKILAAASALTIGANMLIAATRGLMQAFNVNISDIFSGVLSESNNFRERLRAIIYETRGFGDLNRAIEEQYRHITAAVDATGVKRGTYQRIMLKNLERGLAIENRRDELGKSESKRMLDRIKRAKAVQTTALSAAKSLSMSVDGMNQMFMDWRMHLGMSVLEIQQMGRGMQDVARQTGLTGSELEKAVKAADAIMKKMKNAGRLSAESSKAVMAMMAAGQKYGVGDQMGKMMEALSSPFGFLEASNQMKVLMLRSAQLSGDNGLAQRVMFGQATSASDLTKLATGFEENMRRTMKGMGIDDEYLKQQLGIEGGLDMTNLSGMIQEMERVDPAKARHLQLTLEQAYGMGIGEIEQFAKSFDEAAEANKPFGERINNMTAELKKMEDAGLGASDAANELRARLKETNTTALQDCFTAWQAAVRRSGGDLDKARADLATRLESTMGPEMAREFASNIGGSASQLLDDLGSRAEEQGKDLNDLLKKRGMSMEQVQRAMTSGSAEEMESAMTVLNEAQQEIGRAERTGQDPMTETRDQLISLNNKLGALMDSVFFKIPDLLFKALFWLGTIGGILGSLLSFFLGGQMISGLLTGAGVPGGGGLMGAMGGGGAAGGGLAASASIAGAIAAPIMMLVGAFKGFSEAEEAGRSKMVGSLLGIFTGGAGTGGGLVGSVLGTEEGTGADKAAGVATAGLWGAGLGAAIGTAIAPGIGTAIGAAIGGVVGMFFQWLKILTEGTKLLEHLFEPIQIIWDYILGNLTDVWNIIKGIFTLDFSLIIDSIMNIIGRVFALIPSLILWAFKTVVYTLPNLIMRALKALIFDLPMFIWGAIKAGLENLATSEWVGPIFQTLSDAFNEIYEVFMEIYTPLSEAFGAIIGIFTEIGEAIFGASEGGSVLSTVLGWVKWAVHGLATVIGILLKPLVWFATLIKWMLKPLVLAAKFIKWLVDGVVGAFRWLYEVIFGNSIVPELIEGIIGCFMSLLTSIPQILLDLSIAVIKGLGSLLLGLPRMLWNGLKGLGKLVWEGIKSLPGLLLDGFMFVVTELPQMLWNGLTEALGNIGTWLWDHTIGALLNVIPDWVKNLFGGGDDDGEGGGVFGAVTGVIDGVGDVIGGLGDAAGKLMKGDVLGAAGDAIGGVVSGVGSVVGGVVDTVGSVASALNPLNWFDEGTNEVANTGLAIVHEGETIIPAGISKEIAAEGKGKFDAGTWIDDLFGGGTGLGDMFGGIGDWFGGGVDDVLGGGFDMLDPFSWFGGGEEEESSGGWLDGLFGGGGIDAILEDIFPDLKKQEASPEDKGAFDPDSSKKALEDGIEVHDVEVGNMLYDALMTLGEMQKTSEAGVEQLGAFDPENPNKAMEGGLSEKAAEKLKEDNRVDGEGGEEGKTKEDKKKKPKKGFWDYVADEGLFGGGISWLSNAMGDDDSEAEISETGMGLFDMGNIFNAMGGGIDTMIGGLFDPFSSITSSFSDMLSPASIFGGGGSGGSWIKTIINDLESSLTEKEKEDQKSGVADAGKALYYDLGGGGPTGMPIVDSILASMGIGGGGGGIGGLLGAAAAEASAGSGLDYTEEMKGEVSSNPLDYSEDTKKGMVSPAALSLAGMQEKVAAEKAGEVAEGTGTALGMGGVEGLMNDEISLLNMMYEVLLGIRDNTLGKPKTKVIEAQGNGAQSPHSQGVKSIAMDYVRGYWDLTTGDYAPPAVTSDGRGGN